MRKKQFAFLQFESTRAEEAKDRKLFSNLFRKRLRETPPSAETKAAETPGRSQTLLPKIQLPLRAAAKLRIFRFKFKKCKINPFLFFIWLLHGTGRPGSARIQKIGRGNAKPELEFLPNKFYFLSLFSTISQTFQIKFRNRFTLVNHSSETKSF